MDRKPKTRPESRIEGDISLGTRTSGFIQKERKREERELEQLEAYIDFMKGDFAKLAKIIRDASGANADKRTLNRLVNMLGPTFADMLDGKDNQTGTIFKTSNAPSIRNKNSTLPNRLIKIESDTTIGEDLIEAGILRGAWHDKVTHDYAVKNCCSQSTVQKAWERFICSTEQNVESQLELLKEADGEIERLDFQKMEHLIRMQFDPIYSWKHKSQKS